MNMIEKSLYISMNWLFFAGDQGILRKRLAQIRIEQTEGCRELQKKRKSLEIWGLGEVDKPMASTPQKA